MSQPKSPSPSRSKQLCGKSVSWWDGEYDGECELPKGHHGPHYDGISCFDDDGDEVELKHRPISSITVSVGYYKSGKPYQVHHAVLNNDSQISLYPESGVEIRVEFQS